MVQETARVSSIAPGDIEATFAATPPLEALRFLLPLAMTFPPPTSSFSQDGPDDWVIVFIDISRARPHCETLRKIVIELPEEAGYDKSYVGVLKKCLYGIMDEPQAFELKAADVMCGFGFYTRTDESVFVWT